MTTLERAFYGVKVPRRFGFRYFSSWSPLLGNTTCYFLSLWDMYYYERKRLSGEYLFLSLFLFSPFSLGLYRVFFHSLHYTVKKYKTRLYEITGGNKTRTHEC